MYIGKGRMVHAPHSGRNVEISPLGRTAGAVRPK
jgi:cell wall-associated NlpC family hydrolase